MLNTLAIPVTAATAAAPATPLFETPAQAPRPAGHEWARDEPAGNRLLALLRALAPNGALAGLERVALPAGRVLLQRGRAVTQVWFPEDALVSALGVLRNGASLEVALVGAEGLIGWEACLGGLPAAHDAMVQVSGGAWRLPAPALAALCRRLPVVQEAVMHANVSLLAQAGQIAACYRHHCMEQQVSRWLLTAAERLQGQELPMTQERLSALLGVRREGVTECARRLQAAGLIRYARGRIRVLDAAGLATRACECHGVLRGARLQLHDALDRLAGAR